MSATPLNELLSRALVGITRAYERADPDAPSLPLLMLEGSQTASKRAMVAINKQLPGALGGGSRSRGAAALAKAEKKFASLRAPLGALVDKFELELPHYWVTYGAADPTVTGGRYRPGDDGPPRLPPHGADWKPVLRTAKGAKDLPVTALVAQALCNFALDYEVAGPPLGWTIHGALAIDPKTGTPMAEVPRFANLTGDGRSGLERHGVVKVGPKPRQIAKLTEVGKRVRELYPAHAFSVEQRWRDVYGESAVARVRAALEKVAPPGPPHPYLVWNPVLREDSIP
ncbi:MAG: hypothetical protein QOK28_1978 [Actinomycetota bacterium]|jgi:hypothetical protein